MALIFTIQESGGNLILSGTGTMNMSGVSDLGDAGVAIPSVLPSGFPGAGLIVGPSSFFPPPGPNINSFREPAMGFSGPKNIGTGTTISNAEIFDISGDGFGYRYNQNILILPQGYSGQTLNGSATITGETLSSVGISGGTYTWTASNGDYVQISALLEPSPTPTPTETSAVTPTPTETSAVTPTPTATETPTPTPTPTATLPGQSYGFNLVALPYNFPSSGNSIMNNSSGITSGATNINELGNTSRGFYFNTLDENGVDRTSYFSTFTGQSITITFNQNGNVAIYSGDTDSFKYYNETGETGFVFGTGIGFPSNPTPSGVATLIQSSPVDYTIGLPVYISLNGGSPSITPTPTPTETAPVTPTPTETAPVTPTPTETAPVTPTPSVTETPPVTPTPSVTETPTETPTPTPTETSAVTPTPTETPAVTPTITPSLTPTLTPTPTATNGTVTLNLSAIYNPGSIWATYVVTASTPVDVDVQVTFTNILGVTSGEPYVITGDILIPLGQTSGSETFYLPSGDYSVLDFTSTFTGVTTDYTGATSSVFVVSESTFFDENPIAITANTDYNVCVTCSGTTYTVETEHPVWTGLYGETIIQANAVQLGGRNGLYS